MKVIKLLYLYPDILELYGDFGNIQVLKYRCEKRGIKFLINEYSIGDETPNFSDYDIVFAGGGADNEQSILAKDLIKYKDNIRDAIDKGTFFLLICGAYQLFGKYYKSVDEVIIPGLEIFDYYTEAIPDRRKRCIGNIVTKAIIDGKETEIIGFENHGGQTHNVHSPFGKVVYGNGNRFESGEEGYFAKNIIATYMHGPLLSKNPDIADYIIKYCLERKNNKKVELEKLDDSFEKKCRSQLLKEFLKDNKKN